MSSERSDHRFMNSAVAIGLVVWIAAALFGVVMYALGAAIGYRRGYEEGWKQCQAYAREKEIVLPDLQEVRRSRSP
jgi:type IV secretory pathway TrbD component